MTGVGSPAGFRTESRYDDMPEADAEWEYRPLRIEPHLSRSAAAALLSIRAEFSGWELVRSLCYADGTRRVWLRRRRSPMMLPGLAT
jgi:hypothetical protein